MIKISFDPDDLSPQKKKEWDDWIARSEAATAQIINEWELWMPKYEEWWNEYDKWKKENGDKADISNYKLPPPEFEPKFNDRLWKDMRDWMLENVCNNKCSYCEISVVGFVGDTEHFRPKNRVRIPGEGYAKYTNWCGETVDHPGYFWLAYHWKNLLPSCQNCNRKVKLDLFPVSKANVAMLKLTDADLPKYKQPRRHQNKPDLYYVEPEDLDRDEEPKLLHPIFEDPKKHIEFGVDGKAFSLPRSTKGELSITNFDLNAKYLVDLRRIHMELGLNKYLSTIAAAGLKIKAQEAAAKRVINEYLNNTSPFAGAVIGYIHNRLKKSPIDPYILLNWETAEDEKTPTE